MNDVVMLFDWGVVVEGGRGRILEIGIDQERDGRRRRMTTDGRRRILTTYDNIMVKFGG